VKLENFSRVDRSPDTWLKNTPVDVLFDALKCMILRYPGVLKVEGSQ
jgi:hypothetical protein